MNPASTTDKRAEPTPSGNSPEFVRPAERVTVSRARWWLWATVPVLTVILLLQIAVADRARLAADPAWRPRILALCDWLRCSVPDWREPSAFHITSREVRPHPSAPGVLL